MFNRFLRIISFILLCLFCGETAFSEPYPSYTVNVTVPKALGVIKSVYNGIRKKYSNTIVLSGNSNTPVIILEDSHSSYSAQKNIYALLKRAAKNTKGKILVAVEGGTSELDDVGLNKYPFRDISERALNLMVFDGYLTGAEKLRLLNDNENIVFCGVENEELLNKTYDCLKRILIFQQKYESKFRGKEFSVEKDLLDGLDIQGKELFNYYKRFVSGDTAVFVPLIRMLNKVGTGNEDLNIMIKYLCDCISFKENKSLQIISFEKLIGLLDEVMPSLLIGFSKDSEVVERYFNFSEISKLLYLKANYDCVNKIYLNERKVYRLLKDKDLIGWGKAALAFYAFSKERERYMGNKLIEISKVNKYDVIYFVIGGYHVSYFEELLKKNDISFSILMPLIEDNSVDYYKRIFAAEDNKFKIIANGADKFNLLLPETFRIMKKNKYLNFFSALYEKYYISALLETKRRILLAKAAYSSGLESFRVKLDLMYGYLKNKNVRNFDVEPDRAIRFFSFGKSFAGVINNFACRNKAVKVSALKKGGFKKRINKLQSFLIAILSLFLTLFLPYNANASVLHKISKGNYSVKVEKFKRDSFVNYRGRKLYDDTIDGIALKILSSEGNGKIRYCDIISLRNKIVKDNNIVNKNLIYPEMKLNVKLSDGIAPNNADTGEVAKVKDRIVVVDNAAHVYDMNTQHYTAPVDVKLITHKFRIKLKPVKNLSSVMTKNDGICKSGAECAIVKFDIFDSEYVQVKRKMFALERKVKRLKVFYENKTISKYEYEKPLLELELLKLEVERYKRKHMAVLRLPFDGNLSISDSVGGSIEVVNRDILVVKVIAPYFISDIYRSGYPLVLLVDGHKVDFVNSYYRDGYIILVLNNNDIVNFKKAELLFEKPGYIDTEGKESCEIQYRDGGSFFAEREGRIKPVFIMKDSVIPPGGVIAEFDNSLLKRKKKILLKLRNLMMDKIRKLNTFCGQNIKNGPIAKEIEEAEDELDSINDDISIVNKKIKAGIIVNNTGRPILISADFLSSGMRYYGRGEKILDYRIADKVLVKTKISQYESNIVKVGDEVEVLIEGKGKILKGVVADIDYIYGESVITVEVHDKDAFLRPYMKVRVKFNSLKNNFFAYLFYGLFHPFFLAGIFFIGDLKAKISRRKFLGIIIASVVSSGCSLGNRKILPFDNIFEKRRRLLMKFTPYLNHRNKKTIFLRNPNELYRYILYRCNSAYAGMRKEYGKIRKIYAKYSNKININYEFKKIGDKLYYAFSFFGNFGSGGAVLNIFGYDAALGVVTAIFVNLARCLNGYYDKKRLMLKEYLDYAVYSVKELLLKKFESLIKKIIRVYFLDAEIGYLKGEFELLTDKLNLYKRLYEKGVVSHSEKYEVESMLNSAEDSIKELSCEKFSLEESIKMELNVNKYAIRKHFFEYLPFWGKARKVFVRRLISAEEHELVELAVDNDYEILKLNKKMKILMLLKKLKEIDAGVNILPFVGFLKNNLSDFFSSENGISYGVKGSMNFFSDDKRLLEYEMEELNNLILMRKNQIKRDMAVLLKRLTLLEGKIKRLKGRIYGNGKKLNYLNMKFKSGLIAKFDEELITAEYENCELNIRLNKLLSEENSLLISIGIMSGFIRPGDLQTGKLSFVSKLKGKFNRKYVIAMIVALFILFSSFLSPGGKADAFVADKKGFYEKYEYLAGKGKKTKYYIFSDIKSEKNIFMGFLKIDSIYRKRDSEMLYAIVTDDSIPYEYREYAGFCLSELKTYDKLIKAFNYYWNNRELVKDKNGKRFFSSLTYVVFNSVMRDKILLYKYAVNKKISVRYIDVLIYQYVSVFGGDNFIITQLRAYGKYDVLINRMRSEGLLNNKMMHLIIDSKTVDRLSEWFYSNKKNYYADINIFVKALLNRFGLYSPVDFRMDTVLKESIEFGQAGIYDFIVKYFPELLGKIGMSSESFRDVSGNDLSIPYVPVSNISVFMENAIHNGGDVRKLISLYNVAMREKLLWEFHLINSSEFLNADTRLSKLAFIRILRVRKANGYENSFDFVVRLYCAAGKNIDIFLAVLNSPDIGMDVKFTFIRSKAFDIKNEVLLLRVFDKMKMQYSDLYGYLYQKTLIRVLNEKIEAKMNKLRNLWGTFQYDDERAYIAKLKRYKKKLERQDILKPAFMFPIAVDCEVDDEVRAMMKCYEDLFLGKPSDNVSWYPIRIVSPFIVSLISFGIIVFVGMKMFFLRTSNVVRKKFIFLNKNIFKKLCKMKVVKPYWGYFYSDYRKYLYMYAALIGVKMILNISLVFFMLLVEKNSFVVNVLFPWLGLIVVEQCLDFFMEPVRMKLGSLLLDVFPCFFEFEVMQCGGLRGFNKNALRNVINNSFEITNSYAMGKLSTIYVWESVLIPLSVAVVLPFISIWLGLVYPLIVFLVLHRFKQNVTKKDSTGEVTKRKEEAKRQWLNMVRLRYSIGLLPNAGESWKEVDKLVNRMIREKVKFDLFVRLSAVLFPGIGAIAGFPLSSIALSRGMQAFYFISEFARSLAKGFFAESEIDKFVKELIRVNKGASKNDIQLLSKRYKYKRLLVDNFKLVVGNENKDILKGVNMSIDFGSLVFIGGGSGVGKTIFLQSLAQIYDPEKQSGNVYVVCEKGGRKAKYSVKGDASFFYYNSSDAFDSVATINELASLIDDIEKRDKFYTLLKRYINADISSVPLHDFSRGQSIRVKLAFIISVSDAPVILLDQAFEGVERSIEEDWVSFLRSEARRYNKIIVIASHEKRNIRENYDMEFLFVSGRLVKISPLVDIGEQERERLAEFIRLFDVNYYLLSNSFWKTGEIEIVPGDEIAVGKNIISIGISKIANEDIDMLLKYILFSLNADIRSKLYEFYSGNILGNLKDVNFSYSEFNDVVFKIYFSFADKIRGTFVENEEFFNSVFEDVVNDVLNDNKVAKAIVEKKNFFSNIFVEVDMLSNSASLGDYLWGQIVEFMKRFMKKKKTAFIGSYEYEKRDVKVELFVSESVKKSECYLLFVDILQTLAFLGVSVEIIDNEKEADYALATREDEIYGNNVFIITLKRRDFLAEIMVFVAILLDGFDNHLCLVNLNDYDFLDYDGKSFIVTEDAKSFFDRDSLDAILNRNIYLAAA